jgi:hypothetical protein
MTAQSQLQERSTVDAADRLAPPAVARRPRLEVARTAPAGAPGAAVAAARRKRLDPSRLLALAAIALLALGLGFETERYITPQTGLGYALGIAGGSSMLLLLVYPLRKRVRALSIIGTTKRWFQAHMVLGVVGPILVLFHSNFSLGATNSNVALACMLVVSGSGLFGRYFYTRIHHGLHGRRANLAELQDYAEKLRWVTTSVEFLPDLVTRIEAEEKGIIRRCERLPMLARPPLCAASTYFARRRLRRYVVQSLPGSRGRSDDRGRRANLIGTASSYIDDRLSANRRVVEFSAFERLFSLWHALHLPLFLMLLIAGVVHVAAVHVY